MLGLKGFTPNIKLTTELLLKGFFFRLATLFHWPKTLPFFPIEPFISLKIPRRGTLLSF